jgi:hypothetical protein
MNKNNICILFGIILLLTNSAFAKKDTISVEKAFNNKLIKLTIMGKGGHQGACITMNIKNEFNDSMLLFIEAGRRLDSKDSTEQDIFVVKDIFIPLASNQEKLVDVTGFCCQANNHAPKVKSIFGVGKLADKNLYELGRYLNKNQLNNSLIQNAVWCISDNHEVASIIDDGTEEVAKLRKFITKLKNLPTEYGWYSIYYSKVKDQLFSGLPERVTGNFDYYVNDFSHVFVNIRDIQGTVVKSFEVNKSLARGSYTYHLDWDVGKTPIGLYTIRIYENERELKKLAINLK